MFDCYSEQSEFFFSEYACVIHLITSSCISFHFCSEDIELYVCRLRELQRGTKSPCITFYNDIVFSLLNFKLYFFFLSRSHTSVLVVNCSRSQTIVSVSLSYWKPLYGLSFTNDKIFRRFSSGNDKLWCVIFEIISRQNALISTLVKDYLKSFLIYIALSFVLSWYVLNFYEL